jgi:hypothetical protein
VGDLSSVGGETAGEVEGAGESVVGEKETEVLGD